MTLADAPDILTPKQVSELFQIPRRTLYELLRNGQLPGAQKFGRSWRIHRDTVLGSWAGNPQERRHRE